jgi:hypothetical protein
MEKNEYAFLKPSENLIFYKPDFCPNNLAGLRNFSQMLYFHFENLTSVLYNIGIMRQKY